MSQKPTPSFVLALPLRVNSQQATHFQAHCACARQLSNALLAEAMKRLTRMKADPAWQTARTMPRSDKSARSTASPHTAYTRRPNACAPAGSPSTSTASWPRSWPAAPIRRLIGRPLPRRREPPTATPSRAATPCQQCRAL